ncbi:hypothetical protein OFN64_35110, partial [Escherichia coli]|nr:hypothetical protein [Escherichia coli]
EANEKRRYAPVFIDFARNYQSDTVPSIDPESVKDWEKTIESHFMHEEDAGELMLVLRAMNDWHNIKTADSVFDTPLFQPLKQGDFN